MIKFLSDNLWNTLSRLSRKAKQTKVAVAYFGTGAADRLTLKKGDTLLVAMSLDNVKMGQVNPFEIQKLIDKGVSIFSLPNLQAKIYLFDSVTITASANISTHSANSLIEAAVMTDDKNILRAAESFIDNHCVEKVEQDYIELCKQHYTPPKFPVGGTQLDRKKTSTSQFSRLWVISAKPDDFTDDEYEFLEQDEAKYERKITNKRTFELREIRYPSRSKFINSVTEGDIIIEILCHKVKTQVIQPKRALGVSFDPENKKAYLRVEELKKPIIKGWVKLETYLKQNGIKAIKKNCTREIKNENTKRLLLKYFS